MGTEHLSTTLEFVLIARPLLRTREIRFEGSSAILVAAIKIDVERLKKFTTDGFIAINAVAALRAAGFKAAGCD